jgi:hypothetical protein
LVDTLENIRCISNRVIVELLREIEYLALGRRGEEREHDTLSRTFLTGVSGKTCRAG